MLSVYCDNHRMVGKKFRIAEFLAIIRDHDIEVTQNGVVSQRLADGAPSANG